MNPIGTPARCATAEDVVGEVIAVITDVLGLEGRPVALTAGSALLDALPELDSMAIVELIVALEETFGIEVDEDEITGEVFETVATLAAFVGAQHG